MNFTVVPHVHELQCKNPNCHFISEDSIEMGNLKNYVDLPCPVCGEVLMEQQDCNLLKQFFSLIKLIESTNIIQEHTDTQLKLEMDKLGVSKIEIFRPDVEPKEMDHHGK